MPINGREAELYTATHWANGNRLFPIRRKHFIEMVQDLHCICYQKTHVSWDVRVNTYAGAKVFTNDEELKDIVAEFNVSRRLLFGVNVSDVTAKRWQEASYVEAVLHSGVSEINPNMHIKAHAEFKGTSPSQANFHLEGWDFDVSTIYKAFVDHWGAERTPGTNMRRYESSLPKNTLDIPMPKGVKPPRVET